MKKTLILGGSEEGKIIHEYRKGAGKGITVVKPENILRVKLLNLPDQAQAVVHLDSENFMQMTVYGYDSKNEPVQLVTPFTFQSDEQRDLLFANEEKLTDFAKGIFLTQMAVIDPELNTDKFIKTKI